MTLSEEPYEGYRFRRWKVLSGDHLFVRQKDGSLLTFEVFSNLKIGSADVEGLQNAAGAFDNTLTLLTCEDERPEGGYASRRIVSGKMVND